MNVLLVTILLMLCWISPAQARPLTPLEGLEALRKAFSGITDFSAEMTQEKRLSLMKRTMTMNGTVRFRKPDLFYLEIVAPYASRMLLRDATIEQVAGGGERNRVILPPDQGLKSWFSRLSTPVSTLPDGLAVQADLTNSVYTLTITPQGKGQVKDISIVFLGNGTIKRLVINERNGDRATMTMKNVRRNIGLTEQDFRLEPLLK